MQEEVFIHQTLQKFGATPEEALAFAKIYGNMLEALAQDIKADLKKELEAIKETNKEAKEAMEGKYKWLIRILIGATAYIPLLLTVIALINAGVWGGK